MAIIFKQNYMDEKKMVEEGYASSPYLGNRKQSNMNFLSGVCELRVRNTTHIFASDV